MIPESSILKIKNEVETLGGNLIAVSKKKSADEILRLVQLGVHDFGENYVQEALEKIKLLEGKNIKWHFIGKVQTNNISKLVDKFEVLQTLYKFKHFEKINSKSTKVQKVLIQVKSDLDERDNGLLPHELKSFIQKLKLFDRINLKGLMYLAPKHLKGQELYRSFQEVQALFESVSLPKERHDWDSLSMGMSQDYIQALENGATHVRIGTAIFGERK